WLSPVIGSIRLAFLQFVVCSALSLITATMTETISLQALCGVLVPILYGGFLSVGIAYTLQVVAQRDAHPAHAAIILSLESVFAALTGWILLGESLTLRAFWGCGLMLAGMLLSQFNISLDGLKSCLKMVVAAER
ncbi:MAG: EamA family transporter, partial [Acidobacteriota bacterium]